MGADTAPVLLFEGVVAAAAALGVNYTLVVYATPQVLAEIASQCKKVSNHATIEWDPCHEVIEMDEEPVVSVKKKQKASLVLGLRSLANRSIDAFVSCGNTGALVTASVLFLNKFPKILRPALIATLPSEKGPVVVIDVGGSTACKARNLVQFALLGAAYQRVIHGVNKPVVGLLNIGIESKKGRDEIREAYNQLETLASEGAIAFAGNVEGRDVFKGAVEVIVTDGFTGNVLLKTAEGTAAFVFDMLKARHQKDSATLSFGKQLCEEQQCGALLCGVDRTVLKVHGNSSPQTLHRAILKAVSCVQSDSVSRMKALISM